MTSLGDVAYTSVAASHDVVVTDVLPSKTVVCRGYSQSIVVPVLDLGDYPETFNVTLGTIVEKTKTSDERSKARKDRLNQPFCP
jgi:hypothetical protein